MLWICKDGIERRFDTGDKVVDELLRQLDHYARGFGAIRTAHLMSMWLDGVISVANTLPSPYREYAKPTGLYSGGPREREDERQLDEESIGLKAQLSDALEKIISNEELAGRSNTYLLEGRNEKPKYGDRRTAKLPVISRNEETTGEAISRLCNELKSANDWSASSATLDRIREIISLGNSDIRFNGKALERLVMT